MGIINVGNGGLKGGTFRLKGKLYYLYYKCLYWLHHIHFNYVAISNLVVVTNKC